jgi:hypothetical protein
MQRGQGAPAERRKARIVADERGVQFRLRAVAPAGHDAQRAGEILDRNLGAQLVETQPLGEVGRLRPRAIEVKGAVCPCEDDKVEQDLALRAEQRAEARLSGDDAVEVAGQQPVEEGLGLLAAHPDDAAIGKIGYRHDAHPQHSRDIGAARRGLKLPRCGRPSGQSA